MALLTSAEGPADCAADSEPTIEAAAEDVEVDEAIFLAGALTTEADAVANDEVTLLMAPCEVEIEADAVAVDEERA